MTAIIVPLAGRDCYSDEFGIRPLFPVGGTPIISHVLQQRSWIKEFDNTLDSLTFIIRKEEPHSSALENILLKEFPFCHITKIPRLTLGAPFTCLAGISTISSVSEPIILDLADIVFELPLIPKKYFETNYDVKAIAPYFISDHIKFSYLKCNPSNILEVIEAREKMVISNFASAGVYIFKNLSVFVECLNFGIQNQEVTKVHESFFVCPLLNGLIKKNQIVHALQVDNADPIGSLFHLT